MRQKSLLVVGASSALGAAIVREATARQYRVIGTARENGGQHLQMDVTSDVSVQAAIAAVIADTGSLDAVVYAPALSIDGLIHALDVENWLRVFNVNVFGAARVVRQVLPHFIKARSGVFQFISSTAALRGATGAAPYACSKAALNALAKNIATDYGRFDIRAFAVMPGFIDGGMLADLPEDKKAAIARGIPLKRLATPEEVARFCVATLDSASYLSGTALAYDGGLGC